jgi:hypothetical protein
MVKSFKTLTSDTRVHPPARLKSRVRVIRTLAPREPPLRLLAAEEVAVLETARREDALASLNKRIKELRRQNSQPQTRWPKSMRV